VTHANVTVNNVVTVPITTLSNTALQLFTNNQNMALVRITVGDPANNGRQTVIELMRDNGDGAYVGSMTTLDSVP
jgi:hypothetical protein